ncbi:MAG: hypothetical protein IE909_04000 [Campylobacterales bacterium]|nr:hypothetical protein [Campylobacterales bacterium]
MQYTDIFILGWNLNALMFVVNLYLATSIIRTSEMDQFEIQRKVLHTLQTEFEQYYPNRKIETLFSYLIPFTAFYRVLFRLLEMFLFFQKNKNTKMYDFVVYKYQSDIEKAKNKE